MAHVLEVDDIVTMIVDYLLNAVLLSLLYIIKVSEKKGTFASNLVLKFVSLLEPLGALWSKFSWYSCKRLLAFQD